MLVEVERFSGIFMFKNTFSKLLFQSLNFTFLVIVNGSATAGPAAENLEEKRVPGRFQADVGDFGSSQIGPEEINKRVRALEIDEVLTRSRQIAKSLMEQPLVRVICNPDKFDKRK